MENWFQTFFFIDSFKVFTSILLVTTWFHAPIDALIYYVQLLRAKLNTSFERIEFINHYLNLALVTYYMYTDLKSGTVHMFILSPKHTKTEQSNYIICGVEFDVCVCAAAVNSRSGVPTKSNKISN